MKRYLEHERYVYVIATLESPTQYLFSQNDNIFFTLDIARCTKMTDLSIARFIRDDFYARTHWYDFELAIVPLIISYELVNEDEEDDEVNM